MRGCQNRAEATVGSEHFLPRQRCWFLYFTSFYLHFIFCKPQGFARTHHRLTPALRGGTTAVCVHTFYPLTGTPLPQTITERKTK